MMKSATAAPCQAWGGQARQQFIAVFGKRGSLLFSSPPCTPFSKSSGIVRPRTPLNRQPSSDANHPSDQNTGNNDHQCRPDNRFDKAHRFSFPAEAADRGSNQSKTDEGILNLLSIFPNDGHPICASSPCRQDSAVPNKPVPLMLDEAPHASYHQSIRCKGRRASSVR